MTHGGQPKTDGDPSPGAIARLNRHRRRTNGRKTIMVGVRFTAETLAKIDDIVLTSEFPTSRAGVIEALVVRAMQAANGIRAAI